MRRISLPYWFDGYELSLVWNERFVMRPLWRRFAVNS